MSKLLLVLSFAWCVSFHAIQAANTSNVQAITVTATRLPSHTAATGRSLFVLTRKQIEAMPVASVDEVLRFVPGLETQQRGPFGTQTDFVMRGSTFSQVLVLVDGMRINDPLTGHYNSYIPVALSEVEQIEVLRGPAAALWGPDAVGGVINIITSTLSHTTQSDTTTSANIELGGGSNGLLSFRGGGSVQQGETLLSGGVTGFSSTGYARTNQPPADFTLLTGSVSTRYNLDNNSSMALRVGGDSKDFDARYYYTRSTADQSRETVQTLWLQGMVQHRTNNGTLRLDLAYKRLRDQFNFNPTFSSINSHTTGYANAMLSSHFSLTDNVVVGGGLQADERTIVSTDRGNHKTLHVGAYALSAITFDNVVVNGSARVDYDKNYQWQFTPQASAVYTLGILGLRGSVGRSVRAADYTERYVSTNLPAPLTPGRNLGNPNLSAETNWSWEVGTDLSTSKYATATITAFSRDGRNQIDYAPTNSNSIPNNTSLVTDTMYFYAQNIASVQTQGVEMQVSGDYNIAEHCVLRYVLGYTVVDIASTGTQTKYLTTTAKQLGTMMVTLDWNRLQFTISGLHKLRNADTAPTISAVLTPSYFVANAIARYRIAQKAGAYIQVNNLADLSYTDVLGAQMPGRWISAGLFAGF